MNAFVAGNLNEVKDLALALLDATRIVEDAMEGSDVDITYKDGKIIISYKPSNEH